MQTPNAGQVHRPHPGGPARATTFQLVFITYSIVCSGAYGLEEMVPIAGPGLSVAVLLVLPFVYAAPLALACAELAARFPVEGGYYRWVRMAFGDAVGYTSGWLVWVAMFATNASFAVLFASYLRYFVPELSALSHVAAAAAVIWFAVLLNCRGITLVGRSAVVFTVLIFLPFAVMTVLGIAQWRNDPFQPFVNPDVPPSTALVGAVLVAMWLYGGFEKITVIAGEVEQPARAFPTALMIAVPLCALSYIVPTVAALAAAGDWRDWEPSYYMTAAARIGGPLLGAGMAAGALISNTGILMATILSQSRLPMVLAEDGLFPSVFRRVHERFGTPVLSLVTTGIVLTALSPLPFGQLVAAAAVVQSLSYMLIYAALFRLRRSPGYDASPGFRIRLGIPGLALMVAPSVAIVLLVLHQGLFPDGRLDGVQALVDLAILSSGPVTYMLLVRLLPRDSRTRAVRPAGVDPARVVEEQP